MKGLLLALSLLMVAAPMPAHPAVSPTSEQPVTIFLTGKERPEDVQRMMDPITRSGRAVQLRFADPDVTSPSPPTVTSPAAAPPAEPNDLIEMFRAGVRHGDAALNHLGGLSEDWRRAWGAADNRILGSPMLSVLAVIGAALLAGFGARQLAGSVIRPPRRHGAHFAARLLVASIALIRDVIGLAAFWLAGHAARDLWTPEIDIARAAASAAVAYSMVTGGYLSLGCFLLSPGRPDTRLLPLPNADRHFWLLIGYGVFGPSILLGVELTQAIATDRLATAGLFTLFAAAITLYKVCWFWSGRRNFEALWLSGAAGDRAPSLARRFGAKLLPWVLIGSAVAIWALGRIAAVAPDGAKWANAAGLTQFLVVLTPVLAAGSAALVRDLLCPDAALGEQSKGVIAFAKVAEPVASAVVWIAGFAALGKLWAFFLLDILSPGLLALLLDALWVGATALVGWILWGFLNALFDAYAPRRAPAKPGEDDDQEAEIQSRLGSIVPILRAFALGAVVGLTALILLSRIGVDIGPLLAGFGIFGLALSFGSQALVRDIVSGIFFIADDAFRVGEYIDTGRLKGTVEKITLRSVQLRHQSGLIHTIPFGQIASVTNASRDWATVKFNIRLERDVDVEQARKIIKKTGQAMQEDPELGPEMILPLKLQGIAEVADNALVCRLKFTSKPARSSWIQREALKRVHAALHAGGIEFATNAVTVRGGDPATGAAAATASSNGVAPSPG